MNRNGVAIGLQITKEFINDVKLYIEGQRIILTGEPKRVGEIEKLIRLLDTNG